MILRIFVLFPFLVQTALSAAASAKIQSINVNCEEDGMGVDIQFDQAFHGVIFSKNFFSTSDCNYVNNPGKDKVHFTIRAGQCGTVQGPPQIGSGGSDSKRNRRSLPFTNDTHHDETGNGTRQSRMDPFGLDFGKIDRMFSLGGGGHGQGSAGGMGGVGGDGSSMYENSREDQPPPEAMEFTGGASQGGQTAAGATPDQSARYAGSQVAALGQLQQPNPNLPAPQTAPLQQLAGMTSVQGNQIGQALTQQVNYAQQPLNSVTGINGLYPASNPYGPTRVVAFNGAPQPPSPPNPYNQYNKAGGQQAPPGAYQVPATGNYQYQPNQYKPDQYQTGQQTYSQYPQSGVPGAVQVGQIDPVTGEEVTTTLAPVEDAYALPVGQNSLLAERPLMRSGNYDSAGTSYSLPSFAGTDTNSAGYAVPSGRQFGGDQYGGGMQQPPAMPQMPNMGGYGGGQGMQMPPAPQMPDMGQGQYGGGQGMQMPAPPQMPDMGGQGQYGGGIPQQPNMGGQYGGGQGMQMPAAPQMPDMGQNQYGGGQGMQQMPAAPQMPDMGGQYGGGQGMQMPAAPQMPDMGQGQYGGGMPQQPALPAELTAYQGGSENGANQGGNTNSNNYGGNSASNGGSQTGSESSYQTTAPQIQTTAPTRRRLATTPQDVQLLAESDEDNNQYLPPSTTKRTTASIILDESDDNAYLPETTTAKQTMKRVALTTKKITTTTSAEDDDTEYLPDTTTTAKATAQRKVLTTRKIVKPAKVSGEEVDDSNTGHLTVVSKSISAADSLPALRAVLKPDGSSGQGGPDTNSPEQNANIAISLPTKSVQASSSNGTGNSGSYGSSAGNGNGGSYSSGGISNQPADQYDAKYETQSEPAGVSAVGQEPAFGYKEPAGQFNNEPKFGYNEPKFGYNTRYESGGADQSGGQEPAFGYHEPAGQFNNEPKFGYNEPAGRFNQEPKFGYNEPAGLGSVDQSGGGREPSFGYNEPRGLSGVDQSGGGREPAFGYKEPGFGYKEPSFGYKEPSFGYSEPQGGIMPENAGAFGKDLSGGPGANVNMGGPGGPGGPGGRSQAGYGGGLPNGGGGGGGSYSGGAAAPQQQQGGGAYGGGVSGAYNGGAQPVQQGGSSNSYGSGAQSAQQGGQYGGAAQAPAQQGGSSYDSGAQSVQQGGQAQQQQGGYDSGSSSQQNSGSSQQSTSQQGSSKQAAVASSSNQQGNSKSSSQAGRQVAVSGSAGASSSSSGQQKQQFASSKPALAGAQDSSDDNSKQQQQSSGSQQQQARGQSQSQSSASSDQQQGQDDSTSHVMSGVQKGQSGASKSSGAAGSKVSAVSAADSSDGGYIENVIIIQNDPLVQEVWDAARAIRCEWRSNYKKTVSTKERIALTEVQTMRFAGDDIEVWMEIQAGKGPWADPVSNIVPIGHTMTLLIGANDPKHEFDLRVGRCIAHDGTSKSQIDLTDDNGCVVRERIMSKFDKAKNWGAESATIAFAHFSAFKFPETTKVFIECDVEVCKRGCAAQCSTKGKITAGASGRHVSVASGSAASGSQLDLTPAAKLGEKFRRKRSIKTERDTLSVKNHYEAVAPADLSFNIDIRIPNSNGTIVYAGVRKPTDESYCMSRGGFGVGVGILVTAVIVSTLSSIFLCLRFRNQRPLLITE